MHARVRVHVWVHAYVHVCTSMCDLHSCGCVRVCECVRVCTARGRGTSHTTCSPAMWVTSKSSCKRANTCGSIHYAGRVKCGRRQGGMRRDAQSTERSEDEQIVWEGGSPLTTRGACSPHEMMICGRLLAILPPTFPVIYEDVQCPYMGCGPHACCAKSARPSIGPF